MAFLHCELKSQSIRMLTSLNVILPQDCSGSRIPAVLYLLHGRSHNCYAWTRYTAIERYAEEYGIAVIMPEANRSFYSDMKYGVSYHEYITQELPDLCESMFQISKRREDTYIAGYSMGGYGAMKAALSCPSRYGGCASFSAVTDIQQHLTELPEDNPKKNEFRGIFGEALVASEEDDLFLLSEKTAKQDRKPRLFMTCGSEDHLFDENLKLKRHLEKLPYDFTFNSWPGVHDWSFWDASVQKALAFFSTRKK